MNLSLPNKYPLESNLTGIPFAFIKSIISLILSLTKASPFELIKINSGFFLSIIFPSSFNESSILSNDLCVSIVFFDLPIGQNIQSKLQCFSGSTFTSSTFFSSSILNLFIKLYLLTIKS